MAYTRAWSDITPADSDAASTLGLAIRNLRADIDERMSTLTNNTWTSDPAGGPLTMKLNISAAMCTYATGDWLNDWIGLSGTVRQGLQLNVSTGYLVVPVVLPQACTLTGIKMAGRVSASGASIIINGVYVGSQIGSMDTVSSLGTSSSPTTNGTWQLVGVGALSHLMADGDVIAVVVKGILAGRIVHYGGLEVTYTRPAPWNNY